MKKFSLLFMVITISLMLVGCFNSNDDVKDQTSIGVYDHNIATNMTGKWIGTYVARQGKSSMHLDIKSIDEIGVVDADVIFQHDNIKGSYKAKGKIDFNKKIVTLNGVSWYKQPKNFYFLSLTFNVSDDSNMIITNSTSHSLNLRKMNEAEIESTAIRDIIIGNWVGTYISSDGLTDAYIEVESFDLVTGVFIAVYNFQNTKVSGSFNVKGTIDYETHYIFFEGLSWIEKPQNYRMINHYVILDISSMKMIGDSDNLSVNISKERLV